MIGYVLYGVEGIEPAASKIAYYHRAGKLRGYAESAGLESRVVYSKRSSGETSAIRRMLKSDWLRERLSDVRAVYGGAAEACGIAAWAMRKTKVPVLYDVHTPPVGERWMAFRMKPSPRELAVYIEACLSELVCIRKADHLLWSSLIQRDYYARRGFPNSRMHEVRHGVDLARFDIGAFVPSDAPLLVYAGTMRAYQGADRLVEAFASAGETGLRLRMIGFTDADEGLRSKASALGIETVGQMPHDRLMDSMRDAAATVIVAHPDAVRYKNGAAPTKWPECLALGRPVISGDAYDTAQLIRDLKVGWVVENSAEGLSQGMRSLAATPLAELAEMGIRARTEAERNYGWQTVGSKFVAALKASSKR